MRILKRKMANTSEALIRIYGVTLAKKHGTRPYGHGLDKIEIDGKEVMIEYVDYFIADLIALIKNQEKEKVFIKKLGGETSKNRKTKQ